MGHLETTEDNQAEVGQAKVVVRHYARLAPAYDRLWDRYSRNSLGKLASSLTLRGDEHILDVACGTGHLAEIIRRKHPGVRFTGVDISPAMISESRTRFPESASTDWHVGTLSSVVLEPASFDVATCANAFHLFLDQEKELDRIKRLLKPGGTICIVDWCREYPQIRGIQALARRFGSQRRNILTRVELQAMMARAGFAVAHIERFRATPFWGMMCVVAELPARRD
jgi:ubiquinone/menaquinone biosynthesis C-methylase UbiE